MDIVKHNQGAWDNYVDKNDRWTIPVGEEVLNKAKAGDWGVLLTCTKSVPHEWFPPLKGLKLLGLASGGGQQGPIFASLGADVTIFDNSSKQLGQDKKVSDEFDLNIKTIQGDMRDLSVFENDSFDLIFNPCSILFVDNIQLIWNECYRVLKPNGILMTGLINPLIFQLKEKDDVFQLVYKQPFSDLKSIPKDELNAFIKNKEALQFGHSISDQIGGQLKAGFLLTDLYEDNWDGTNKMDEYFPAFIATRAIKK